MSKTYYEQLRDPRWQKKRLEIMQRHQFCCANCGSDNETLNIHHTYYEKGLAPWEYPEGSLTCLCQECHKKEQDIQKEIQRKLGAIGFEASTQVLGYLCGIEMGDFPMVATEVIDYEMAVGIGHVFGLSAEEIIDALEDRKIDGWKLSEMESRHKKGNRREMRGADTVD